MRKWKTIVSRVLILVVSILAIGAGRFRYSNLNVEDFSVHIKDSLNSHLTDSADIQRQLNNAGFDRILGTRANELDLHRIEMIAKNDPYVNNAQAYFTLNEELVLEISQRTPILRIQNAAGKSFYVDENGLKMPTSRRGTVKVPFASGNIIEKPAQRDSLTTDIAKQLYYIASYVQKSDLLRSLVTQFYVNEQNEIELTTLLSDHQVILGDSSLLEDKFYKLEMLYKKGFNGDDWNRYKYVNLKFKDQIVCTKK